MTLRDLGERAIVAEILPKYAQTIGNDCASLIFSGNELLLTTDPVPEPAARVLGNDPDPYWMGWLLVTINASDLAASGASPLAFLAAIDASATMEVVDFERLLQGIHDGCRTTDLRYVGGNIREAAKLTAVGTAIGFCRPGTSLYRTGAQAGNAIVSIGQGGLFWRDALLVEQGVQVTNKDSSPLFKPHSQIKAMSRLAKEGLLTAAIDNSDGLLPTLRQFAQANGLSCRLHLDDLSVPELPSSLKIDPARLWLGWGDWNVIAAVQPQNLPRVLDVAAGCESVAVSMGEFVNGDPVVLLLRGLKSEIAPRLESERFAQDSWFSAGIRGYIDLLLGIPLP